LLLDYKAHALHGCAEQSKADATCMNMEGKRVMQPMVLDMVMLIAVCDGCTHGVVTLAQDRHPEIKEATSTCPA
jgi:hypothetical protein